MTNRYITHQQLCEAFACTAQCEEFLRTFPSGRVRVTPERCEKYARKFRFDWALMHLVRHDPAIRQQARAAQKGLWAATAADMESIRNPDQRTQRWYEFLDACARRFAHYYRMDVDKPRKRP